MMIDFILKKFLNLILFQNFNKYIGNKLVFLNKIYIDSR